MKSNKILSCFAIIILFLSIVIGNVFRVQAFDLGVESAILIESETGQVLFEKNADERLSPASITKIMTLLLAMEKIENGALSLQDKVNISKFAESMGGSQIYLPANTRIEMVDLLKAVTISSANDASVAVAEAIAGNYSSFVNMMNKKAEKLDMNNTYFSNSTGLPAESDHYSTARDISIMARELVKYDIVLDWASTWVDYIQLPDRKAMLANTNKLVNKYPGMDGLKTGHTEAAGFCLAATAKRNEMRLISVILKAKNEQEREELTARLLDYGFNRFGKQKVVAKGKKVHNIKVPNGKKTLTTGEMAKDLKVVIKRGTDNDINTKIKIKKSLVAPLKKGDILGQNIVYSGNKQLGAVNIVATEDIARANIIVRLWRQFVNWIGSWLQSI